MKTEQSRPLKKRVLTLCALIIITLGLIAAVLGCVMYFRGMIGKYQEYLTGMIHYCLGEIDGDDLENCIKTKEKSDRFLQEKDMLDRVKKSHKAEYLYIVKPVNADETDNMIDVMAGETEYDKTTYADSEVQLGALTGNAYTAKVAAKYLAGMKNQPQEVSFFFNKTGFGYDYTGLAPIYNSSGDPVAVLAADISIEDIKNVLTGYILLMFFIMLVLSFLFLKAMYGWLNINIVNPIDRMQKSALDFVESTHGKHDPDEIVLTDPKVNTKNELEVLADSMMTMATDMKSFMKDLLRETKERERIGAELNVAANIQADLLPKTFPAFPQRDEFDLFASMTPAKKVGGDFYDFFMVDDDHLALVIADVSGKGVPAALFMVISRTLIKNGAQMGISPSEVLSYANDRLCENNENDMFVTVWLAIIEISTGKGVAANAGHEHPALRRAGGAWELVEYKHSMAVAVMEGVPFGEHEFQLNPGDSLFVYTDGVPEATDANEELFGNERMLTALNEKPDALPKEILPHVKKRVDEFVGDAPQFDDLTMLGISWFGAHEEK